ncbi:MAG: tetratricopeptide repeat protein [Myxococcaceae bacterium]
MKRLLLFTLVFTFGSAMGPLEKNQDDVDEGMTAYEQGDYERALQAFDRAEKAKGSDPRVHYNRGLALHKLNRTDDAKAAFNRALELDRGGEYASKIHYNLGTMAAVNGQKDEAIRELRRALKKDPNDALARHNLEVILRDLPPKSQNGNDGGTPDGGKADGGKPDAGFDGGISDGGSDAGAPDGGGRDGGEGDGGSSSDGGADGGTPKDGGAGDGGSGDGGQGDKDKKGDAGSDGGQGDAGDQGEPNQKSDGGSDGGQELPSDAGAALEPMGLADGGMTPAEAEKLLEPLKRNEKNLQLWRFRQKTQKNDPNGKDW